MILSVAIALLDADSRVLLYRATPDQFWSCPACPVTTDPAAETLVAFLQAEFQVTTFAKALFPLTFATDNADLLVIYGCRNWVGMNRLQQVGLTTGETMWVKPARLLDQPLSALNQAMAPVLMTVLG